VRSDEIDELAREYRYRRYMGIADILLKKLSISYRFKKWDIGPPATTSGWWVVNYATRPLDHCTQRAGGYLTVRMSRDQVVNRLVTNQEAQRVLYQDVDVVFGCHNHRIVEDKRRNVNKGACSSW
jgi:hypothetical protein